MVVMYKGLVLRSETHRFIDIMLWCVVLMMIDWFKMVGFTENEGGKDNDDEYTIISFKVSDG